MCCGARSAMPPRSGASDGRADGPPNCFEIDRGLAKRRVAVASKEAPGEMQRERQVAELRGDDVQVGSSAARSGRCLRSRSRLSGRASTPSDSSLHAEMRAPGGAPAGHQHPAAAASAGASASEQRLVLAVVEHQEARQGPLPLGRDEARPGPRAAGVPKSSREPHAAGAAAGRDLRRHRRGIGEAQPERAAREILPVAMDELARELGLADAAEPGHRRDLPDRRRRAGLQRAGERLQILPRGRRTGHCAQAACATPPATPPAPAPRPPASPRGRASACASCASATAAGVACWNVSAIARLGSRQEADLLLQIVLKSFLEGRRVGNFRREALLLALLVEEHVHLPTLNQLLAGTSGRPGRGHPE